MKAVIQRVLRAKVIVNENEISSIQKGTLTLLGIEKGDTETHVQKLIQKIVELRIFEDADGKMNHSLKDINGAHMIVSQFTLLGDCSKGRRPSFIQAESPARAKELYEKAIQISEQTGIRTAAGIFQADMKIELTNDGPVTFILEER